MRKKGKKLCFSTFKGTWFQLLAAETPDFHFTLGSANLWATLQNVLRLTFIFPFSTMDLQKVFLALARG